VKFSSVKYKTISAEVPREIIRQLVQREDVHRIDPPSKPISRRETVVEGISPFSFALPFPFFFSNPQYARTKKKIDIGVSSHRLRDIFNSYGVNGTHVKVGVVSDSVEFLEEVQVSLSLPLLPDQISLREQKRKLFPCH